MSAAPSLVGWHEGAAVPAPHAVELRFLVAFATEEQLPFVLDSWARSYAPFFPAYAKTYGMGAHGWIRWCAEKLVRRATVVVAALEDVPDVVLGWLCYEPEAMHWGYVKSQARRNGILGAMLPAGDVRRITHRPGKHLRAKCHAMGLRYEPITKEELET